MGEMVKGNFLQVVPMVALGSWINYAFAGFLCAKLPFPLTFRFKPMLQRGMESLVSLDPSWCALSHFLLQFALFASITSNLRHVDCKLFYSIARCIP